MLPNDETGILKENIESVNHITLKSSQNSFSLSFVVSNYIAGKHNTFAYKLKGYHDEWYKQGDISPVSYSNLPAGDYTFLLKAANNGNAMAQFNIGQNYLHGNNGLPKNRTQALNWLRKASNNGHAQAKLMLAGLQ